MNANDELLALLQLLPEPRGHRDALPPVAPVAGSDPDEELRALLPLRPVPEAGTTADMELRALLQLKPVPGSDAAPNLQPEPEPEPTASPRPPSVDPAQAHAELRALYDLLPTPRGSDDDAPPPPPQRTWQEPQTPQLYTGEHVDDLQQLAEAATRTHDVDDAWAGRRDPYDTRLVCGLCAHEQPVTVPFLSLTCRGCASAVLPGRCTTCHHISVVFSAEPHLFADVPCSCGAGVLRPLLRLPAARTTPVEQALGPVGSTTPLGRRLGRGARGALLAAGVGALVAGALVLKAQLADEAAPAPTPVVSSVSRPTGSTPAELGSAARTRLLTEGRPVNVFACRAASPASLTPPGGAETTPALEAFLSGCTGP